ncbi:MAG: TraR/DksA C4-type zinc finger protein [Alphaproteobacteria bacterium]|nr:TraR/DksA C4-type zinc finger protein [Alphaproteobacteria bacterium]
MLDHVKDPSELPADEYLSPQELFELHTILVDQANELLDAAQNNLSELTRERDQDADSLDVATSESDRDFSLRLAGRERRMLSKIKYALECISEREYGICESCGEPIGFKRLMVRPVARVCIDCKTQAEQLERGDRAF